MKNSLNAGFTLIESLIAVTILSFAIAGPLSTASHALVAAQIARGQLTASYLAQEGVEYVRAMRDDAYLNAYSVGGSDVSTAAWADFLDGSNPWSITQCRTTTCMYDPARPIMGTGSGQSLEQCSLAGYPHAACAPLHLVNGIYTEQTSDTGATSFVRTVQVLDVLDTGGNVVPNDKKVVSTVSWSFHGTSRSITVTDHLTPWQ